MQQNWRTGRKRTRSRISDKFKAKDTVFGRVVDVILTLDICQVRYRLLIRASPIRIEHRDRGIVDLVRGIRNLISRVIRRNLETLRHFPLAILYSNLGFHCIDFRGRATDGEVRSWMFRFLTGAKTVVPSVSRKVTERATLAARCERGFGAGSVHPCLIGEDTGVARVIGVPGDAE